jgi:hypothetical protein
MIEDDNLCPLVEISAPLKSPVPLWKQLPAQLYNMTPEGPRLKRYPLAPRYIHLDMAATGVASLGVGHKERSRDNKTIVVMDFVCRITSPNKISFTSMFQFIVDLKYVLGLFIHTFTTDQYQSTALREHAEDRAVALNIRHQSVDRSDEAYQLFGQLVSDQCFKVGKCDVLKTELGNIFIDKGKPYVSQGRKDCADASCGTVNNAVLNASDKPSQYYEDYNLYLTKDLSERVPVDFEVL